MPQRALAAAPAAAAAARAKGRSAVVRRAAPAVLAALAREPAPVADARLFSQAALAVPQPAAPAEAAPGPVPAPPVAPDCRESIRAESPASRRAHPGEKPRGALPATSSCRPGTSRPDPFRIARWRIRTGRIRRKTPPERGCIGAQRPCSQPFAIPARRSNASTRARICDGVSLSLEISSDQRCRACVLLARNAESASNSRAVWR